MKTFEERHPGLKNEVYPIEGGAVWVPATEEELFLQQNGCRLDVIDATQLDKEIVREAAGMHALVFRREGHNVARKYIDYEEFLKELGL